VETLIIGCGYLGMRLAAWLAGQGHRVYGVRRQIRDPEPFQAAGVEPLAIDITRPEQLERIPDTIRWVVNSVSSSRGDAEVYRRVYLDASRTLIRQLGRLPIERYLQVSSTSVYGQTDGSWIEEDDSRHPSSATANILVLTEDSLLDAWRRERFPALLARASGIYGPGRGYLFQRFLRDEARLDGDGSRFLNMVHVDDLARAIAHLLRHGKPGAAYNVTDNRPVSQYEFLAWLAARLGKPLPPSGPQRTGKRARTNKRVSNRRLRRELKFEFRYPTWREGYESAVQAVSAAPGDC